MVYSSRTWDWNGELREGKERWFPVHKKTAAFPLHRTNPSDTTCHKSPAAPGLSEPSSGITTDGVCGDIM